MLDWVELLADETGLPVGIKSAVGDLGFWHELVRLMAGTGRGVDFVTIDGGEGGTGAAPLVFTDSVCLPFRLGFSRVYPIFAEAGLHERVVFIGSGKLGLPENAVVAFALGATWSTSAARRCWRSAASRRSSATPTAARPASRRRTRGSAHGLDPALKSVRCANYIRTLRRDLLKVAEACGVEHPGLIGCPTVEILTGRAQATPLHEVYGYDPGWGYPSAADRAEIARLMRATAPRGGPSSGEAAEEVPILRSAVS